MRWPKRVGNLSQPKATTLLGKQSAAGDFEDQPWGN